MKTYKKICNFISSMKFALFLLVLLTIVCVAGSVITQGNVESYYTGNYPEKVAWLILLLGLDDVFHTIWFGVLTAILCLNLLGCNLLRFPRIIRQMKNYTAEQFEKSLETKKTESTQATVIPKEQPAVDKDVELAADNNAGPAADKDAAPAATNAEPAAGKDALQAKKEAGPSAISGRDNGALHFSGDVTSLFHRMGFQKTESGTRQDGGEYRYGCRNKLGVWGAWLTHLGMLIIIIGFALGQIFSVKYTVYGVPGQTKEIEDTGYQLTIDDFSTTLRDDDTVEQYTAQLTMTNEATGESKSGEASVNHPLSLFGMKLYQNSTGWAAKVTVVEDESEIIQEGILCAGEYTHIGDVDGLYLMFNAFYPDYTTDESGAPATASSEMNNPGYLYTVYYNNEVLGMNVLTGTEMITIDDYSILFREPQQYTLIQIKRDPFTWLAFIGALIIMAALIISFYVRTEELYACRLEDGTWAVYGRSRKGGIIYQEKLQNAVKESPMKQAD